MPDNLKQQTIKGVSWSFVEQILTRSINFVVGIILARLLNPTDFGLVGMLGLFLGVSQLFIDGGLSTALIQTKDPSDKDFSTVYIVNVGLSLVFYSLLFFIAPVVAEFYQQPLLKPLLRVLSLILVIGPLSTIQGTLLQIRVDFKTKSFISLLSAIASGTIGIVFAYRGMGVWALVAQSIAATAASAFFTRVFVRWMPKLVFSKESFKRLFSYSSKLLAATIIRVIYDNVYPMVIGKRFSAADVGQCTRAEQFPNVANGTITKALSNVAFPVFSQIQDDDERLLSVCEKYMQLSCFIIFPILLWLCGSARPLVSFLLTDKWLECVPLMQILCIGLLTNGITTINVDLLSAKGRSDLVLRLEVWKKTVGFAILFITMFFSLKVMFWGRVLYSFVELYLNTFYIKKILGFGFFRQLKVVAPYFLIALVVLIEALLASRFIENDFVSLLVSGTVCFLSYWAIAKLTGIYSYQEIISVIKGKLQ